MSGVHPGLIGLLSFFIAFCGILVWVLNPKNKGKLESYKYIPLQESDDE